MIPAGDYKATLLEYGIKKTQKGDPAATAVFSVEYTDGSFHRIFWQSGWAGGGADITNKALVTMGFTDGRKLPLLANGRASGLLDTDKIYDVKVIIENNEDGTKQYNKIKWINSNSINDTITVQEFGALASQQELISKFMHFAQSKGLKTNSQPAPMDVPDIPF